MGLSENRHETLLQAQYQRAQRLLQEHSTVFLRITQALSEQGELPPQTLAQWLGLPLAAKPSVLEPYADHLAAFAQQHIALGQVVRKPGVHDAQAIPAVALAQHASG